ncbi:MAG: hypothetical protein C0622_05610, partial [Desulfuromonas sp.]
MTKRHELEHHQRSLSEIREIMNSMKTLAYLETRKLDRFLKSQRDVVSDIEIAAADFLDFYPETLPKSASGDRIYLLIGSERGFCGNFNQKLQRHLEPSLADLPEGKATVIAVGRKLYSLLEDYPCPVIPVAGATVGEEIGDTLNLIVRELTAQRQRSVVAFYALYHGSDNAIVAHQLLPPFQHLLYHQQEEPHEPVLHLVPRKFLLEMSYHYLFV